ncbi:hypothetical protein [Aquimarina agarilytica]|uniref:hypothetical protein n=1 Tax=Aquimarina agarilytica TaxID=1087449 RepID=UPI000287CAD1|nr:hypothetical protein [Aquimarina agarilytica]
MNNNLELLSSALRTVGANFDVPTLDLIMTVNELVNQKGLDISLGEVGEISNMIAEKYQLNKN